MSSFPELNGFIAHLQIEYNLSQKTIEVYKRDLAQYFHYAEDNWKSLDMINKFLSYVSDNNLKTTVWRKRASLVRFFKFLWEEDLMLENLTKRIYRPPMAEALPKALAQSEISCVIEELQKLTHTETGMRAYVVLCMIYATAMRVSECISIEMRNIHKDKILIVGKRNKQRWIFLTNQIQDLLKDYLLIRIKWCADDNPYLFGVGIKQHILRQTVGKWLQKTSRKFGIQVSPHGLRHTQATQMLGHVNIIDLAAILGHSSVNTTSRYLKVQPKELASKLQSLHPLAKRD